jgi:hypothetical protein
MAGDPRILAGTNKVVGRRAKPGDDTGGEPGDDTFKASSVNLQATWYQSPRRLV